MHKFKFMVLCKYFKRIIVIMSFKDQVKASYDLFKEELCKMCFWSVTNKKSSVRTERCWLNYAILRHKFQVCDITYCTANTVTFILNSPPGWQLQKALKNKQQFINSQTS